MKKIIKLLLPPAIWKLGQITSLHKSYSPKWNILAFAPMTGVKMFFDPTGKNWQTKMLSGSYDSFLFEQVQKHKPEGKTIYDIGAHIGFHTLYFSKLVGSKGKVVAFEPNPANVERLTENVNANPELRGRISIIDKAVSDTQGKERFMMNLVVESGRSMGNFLEGSATALSKQVFIDKGFKEVTIDTVSIDTLKLNPPQIMKIDVEGAEHKVLIGAQETLKRFKPVLLIEVHSIDSMFNVCAFLTSLNYELTLLKKDTNGMCFIEAV